MSKRHEVSFIDAKVQKWLDEQAPEDGLCLGRFHADLVVEGLDEMTAGQQFEAGGSWFEITEMGKKCFGECKLLARTGKKCPMATGVAFGIRRFSDEI